MESFRITVERLDADMEVIEKEVFEDVLGQEDVVSIVVEPLREIGISKGVGGRPKNRPSPSA